MKTTVIDVGGTFIKYAQMDEPNNFITHGKIPTPLTNRDDFINAIVGLFKSMPDSAALAMSLPGIIDAANGVCITSGQLKYNDGFNVVETFSNILNVPVTIENDAKCAAYAEVQLGSLKDVNDAFVMVFGTGIGGTFIKNRKIHSGAHFSAGEVSFIVTDKDGLIVEEDIFGTQCSAEAICRFYADRVKLKKIDGEQYFNKVESNDDVACDCLDIITRRIALQIHNIQRILDPELFAIGGGISVRSIFIEYIRKNIDMIQEKTKFKLPKPEIVVCQFHNDANLIGAYLLSCESDKI